jgi:hypothetical protein
MISTRTERERHPKVRKTCVWKQAVRTVLILRPNDEGGMIMKLTVDMWTEISVRVNVDLSDTDLQKIADDLGKKVTDLTVEDVRDVASEKAATENDFTGLCVYCSGMGMGSNFSADVGDLDIDDRHGNEYVRIKK